MRSWLALTLIVAACDQQAIVDLRGTTDAGGGREGPRRSGWAVGAGGPGEDGALLAVDPMRDELVIAGRFSGEASFDQLTATATGGKGLYVARLDATGRFLWVLPVQAVTSASVGPRLAVDEAGNAYLAAGGFSGRASVGAHLVDAKGPADVLVVKVDPAGKPAWAVSFGGPGSRPIIPSHTQAIAARGGAVMVTGTFDGELELGGKTHTSQSYDLFVARLDPRDGTIQWAETAGGPGVELGFAIALDAAGDAVVGGALHGNATFGALELEVPSARELYVAKIDAAGRWRWASTSVSRGKEPIDGYVAELALDSEGNIFAAGALYLGYRPLVMKLDPAGTPLCAAAADGAGSSDWDVARALAFEHGRALVAGTFSGTRGFGSTTLSARGRDLFLASVDLSCPDVGESRARFLSAKQAGGPGDDWVGSLAVDRAGNRYLSGSFAANMTLGGTPLASRGESDLFVWKIPATEP